MARWRTLRWDFTAMASPCTVQIDGRDERLMQATAHRAIAEVRRIEAKFSRYRTGSVISRINQQAGGAPVHVDAETLGLLAFAEQLYRLSGGLFDATSGVLRRAWDFKQPRLPDPGVLEATLALVGWDHLHQEGHRVSLKRPGMELDFGGFGKEFAADRAAAVLAESGFRHALVNLGGDLHALGPRGLPELEQMPWRIAIQHPRPVPNQPPATMAVLALSSGGLATSGDYERFIAVDGRRYCHILHPRTGWPVSHWQSMSIVAGSATQAGTLATIAMLKESDALPWLAPQTASYLAIQHDGTVHRAPQANVQGGLVTADV